MLWYGARLMQSGALTHGHSSSPTERQSADAPNAASWSLDVKVQYVFPGTKFTADSLTLNWYNGNSRPPAELIKAQGARVVLYETTPTTQNS